MSIHCYTRASTHCYVGTADPDNPHLVTARSVLRDGHPRVIVPTLAAIWAGHAHHDTHALITAILAYDWQYLDPHTTTASRDQHLVPGVGMTLPATDPSGNEPEPVTVFPLCHARHLDTEWIYLLDPDTAQVAVHTGDGSRLARYRLTGCLPPPTARHHSDNFYRPRPAAGASR